jgi:hypothetical protein
VEDVDTRRAAFYQRRQLGEDIKESRCGALVTLALSGGCPDGGDRYAGQKMGAGIYRAAMIRRLPTLGRRKKRHELLSRNVIVEDGRIKKSSSVNYEKGHVKA